MHQESQPPQRNLVKLFQILTTQELHEYFLRVILGVFFSTDNALYWRAFGTHTKTAKPIEMPFGMMTRVGPIGTMCWMGTRSPKGKGQFLGRKRSVPL